MKAYIMRNADAVIYSHGMESCPVTMLDPLAKEFRIEAYPKTTAVLVRNHGIYVWGDSWISAKTQSECYNYLFEAAIKLHQLGLDWSTPSHGPIQRSNPLLGGQTTNTSQKVGALSLPKQTEINYNCLNHCGPLMIYQFLFQRCIVEDDLQNGVLGVVPVPPDEAGKQAVISALVANVEEMIKSDRKITSLKQLQVYIYSSGSRLAQRLLFGYTDYGDLRNYLCGFCDTTVGNKKESRSYVEISESLGVHKPSEILFVTDVYQEAVAAKAAGKFFLTSR
ncbi:putative class II aldolase/adducin, methylthioribulose-1-phosphate dehydratase, HAD superfamily [Helianthus debilis subsp. tardiflorus]